VIAAIAAVVVLVLLGAFAFTRTQWYVAESNGRVALFQGLKSRPLGIPLSSVEKVYLPVTCLEPVDRTRVSNGYVAKSRADAQRFIDTLPTLPSSSDTGPRLPPDSRPAGKRPAAPPVGAIAPADCRTVGGK
jgi:protein phosphatase